MINPEILRTIRRIEIRTGRLVQEVFAGEYQSSFKGQGIEFDQLREYTPGDDVRLIDWNVTARTGKPFMKQFVQERQLTVMLVVDASASGHFGSRGRTKAELAAELAAVLAFSAIQNKDKVGLLLFTDQVERVILPDSGRRHVLRVIREVLYNQPKGRRTNIAAALNYLNRVQRRRVVVFLISDFLDKNFEKALRLTHAHHDCVAIALSDRREEELASVGWLRVHDAEEGREISVNTADAGVRVRFEEATAKRLQERKRLFDSMGLDAINVRVGESYVEPLIKFFKMRSRRMR
ncbi:MAG: DUF58 domain-containing protein [Candidatus Omnitrophica bacterium]|nr:DUF58 domain-containing protein [Candidatus Omnitrophota bacterium]